MSKLLVRFKTMPEALSMLSFSAVDFFADLEEDFEVIEVITLSISIKLGFCGKVSHFSQTRSIPISDKCSKVNRA